MVPSLAPAETQSASPPFAIMAMQFTGPSCGSNALSFRQRENAETAKSQACRPPSSSPRTMRRPWVETAAATISRGAALGESMPGAPPAPSATTAGADPGAALCGASRRSAPASNCFFKRPVVASQTATLFPDVTTNAFSEAKYVHASTGSRRNSRAQEKTSHRAAAEMKRHHPSASAESNAPRESPTNSRNTGTTATRAEAAWQCSVWWMQRSGSLATMT
mmetsp:Transcript_28730/g.99154  ORF Transcript_28730/g.99154 Transcript_28730/m.99154 type:complete len:221 (-) Transcript_28730:1126-1788(-)